MPATTARPTLADVPAAYRAEYDTGFFIFFDGEFCGWTAKLHPRHTPEEITSWRPGCLAVAAAGLEKGRVFVAVGGSYHTGAERWEPFEVGNPEYDRQLVAGARRILGQPATA